MEVLTESINNLKRITEELAHDIAYKNEHGMLEFVKLIFDCIDGASVEVVSSDFKLLYMSPWTLGRLRDIAGIEVDSDTSKPCYKRIWGRDSRCDNCSIAESIKQRKVLQVGNMAGLVSNPIPIDSILTKEQISYIMTVIPLIYNGVSGAIVLINEYGE